VTLSESCNNRSATAASTPRQIDRTFAPHWSTRYYYKDSGPIVLVPWSSSLHQPVFLNTRQRNLTASSMASPDGNSERGTLSTSPRANGPAHGATSRKLDASSSRGAAVASEHVGLVGVG
jgi:hypothetical protein